MTLTDKLATLKTLLGADTAQEDVLIAYLQSAQAEIFSWKYGYIATADRPTELPADDEQVQIWAVIAGFSQRGAENQTSHSENGISRSFAYSDMLRYIRANLAPYVGVV